MASSATPAAGQTSVPKQGALNAAFAKLMSWTTVKSLTAGGDHPFSCPQLHAVRLLQSIVQQWVSRYPPTRD